MKLRQYTVKEFKSVWDSGSIGVDDKVTCLVGKNEAGKTALLTALYRTNPIIPSDAVFDKTYDYPKREVEDYRFAVENEEREEAVIVECIYELEDDDIRVVSDVLGSKVLMGKTFTRKTHYGEWKNHFALEVDDSEARKHLSNNPDLPEPLRGRLAATADWEAFAAALDEAEDAEDAEVIRVLKSLVAQIQERGLAHYIFNTLILPKAPKFLYFDEYYQMQGCANLNALIQREDAKQLENSDYPLLGLIGLARLNHRELVETQNTAELKNKLEGAGNFLTRRIMAYWSQNRHIKMGFDVRDAKPEDPEGMNEGVNVWGEVYDTVHSAHTPLGSRSRGFVWFFFISGLV